MALNRSNYSKYGSTSDDTEVVIPSNNSMEINSLCGNVSTNSYTVNSCIKNLKSVSGVLGTPKDNEGLRDQIHVWQLSANEVMKATTPIINRMNILARTANKQQKLQVNKVTNHFTEAMQEYSLIQKSVAQKLRTYLLPKPELMSQSSTEADLLLEQDRMEQAQKQEFSNLQFEQELILEKEQRILRIEGDILDINQLMREMGAVIHEQGAVIDTIESNVEAAHQNVQLGQQELTTADRYQSKLRKRKLWLLIIVGIVLSVLIGIIVWASR